MDGLRFWVLGPLRVTSAGGSLILGGPRQRAVLALLLAHPANGLPVSDLIDGVWGEEPPPSADRTLHAYIARLRALLEPDRGPDRAHELLVRTPTGYRLVLTGDQLDSLAFEQAVAAARRQLAAGDTDAAALGLRAAVSLWHGSRAFADLLDFVPIQAAAQRLERMRADAVADSVDADLALGRHELLLPDLQDLVTTSPYDERLWAGLALAYYRCGLQADALGTLRSAREILADELGIDPGRRLRDLQAAILASDPRLDAPLLSGSAGFEHPGLEGRAQELGALRHAWAKVAAGSGAGMVVAGPTGSGRSRLLYSFAAEVRAALGQVLVLDAEDPGAILSPDDLARLVGATASAHLLLLDDLDHASPAAWVAVGRLLDAAAARPVLLVVSVREDNIEPALVGLITRIDPGAGRTVRLTPLEPADVARIAAAYVGPNLALEAAVAVTATSGGLPGAVHARIQAWARERQMDAVARDVVGASADWSGARKGEAHLVADLTSLAVVEATATTARLLAAGPPACPYPALAPFDGSGAAFFAGREELIARAVARLAVTGTLALLGASGVGKSSLVRAGLLPALLAGALPGSEEWRVHRTSPTRGPSQLAAGPDQVVVVDQLEEVLGLPLAARHELAAYLRACTRAGCRMVLVARSDQYGLLAADPTLAGLLDVSALHVPAMGAEQLARAIEVPVLRSGGRCEPELVRALVADLSGHAGALPLLSTTMTRLWELCPSAVLTLDAYSEAGGVSESVARLAERAYQLLAAQDQDRARALLLRMASEGQGGSTVRAFVPLAGLSQRSRRVLGELTDARLVTVEDGSATVSHEAVFSHWPRLAGWLDSDAESRAARARLAAASRMWKDGGRLASDLLRGPRLEVASELARSQPELLGVDDMELLEASTAVSESERRALQADATRTRRLNRRLRSLLASAVALLLVAAGAAGLAVRARQHEASEATTATARGLGAQSLTTGRLDLALLLAAKAAALDPSPSTRGDLLSVLDRAAGATHVLTGTGQRILSVAVGGSRPLVVALDRVGGWSVFDVSSGRRRAAPGLAGLPPATALAAAAFSGDGSTLVLGGSTGVQHDRGLIVLLDATTLARRSSLEEFAKPVVGVTFVGDRGLAVLTADALVHLLGPGGSISGSSFPTKSQVPSGIHADRAGRWLLTDGPAQVWDTSTAKPLSLPTGYPSALSADGSMLAVADGKGVQLVARSSARTLHELAGHTAPVESIAFSPDGKRLATTSDDGTAIIWSTGSGERLATLSGHAGRVNAVGFTPDGREVVTGGFDGRTVVWDMSAATSRAATSEARLAVPAAVLDQSYVALAQRTGRVLLGEPDGTVVLAASATGAPLLTSSKAQQGGVFDAELSADGRLGATVGGDHTIRVWDLVHAKPFAPVSVVQTSVDVASVALSPDDRLIAWGDLTGGLTLASLADGRTIWHRQLDHADPAAGLRGAVLIVSFSRDGRTIGASVSHHATDLVPVSGKAAVRELHAGDDNTSAFAFSPDATTLVTTDSDGSAWRWNLATDARTELGSTDATAASAAIFGAAYDPTGGTVVTWAQDGSIQLWDAASARPIGPPLSDPVAGPVMTAAWEGPGVVVTLQADGLLRRWSVSTAGLLARACSVAGRSLSRQEWATYAPGLDYEPHCD